jgi:hypothetical protein
MAQFVSGDDEEDFGQVQDEGIPSSTAFMDDGDELGMGSSSAAAAALSEAVGAPSMPGVVPGLVKSAPVLEDAHKLQFGEALQGKGLQFLTNTEAAVILEAVASRSESRGDGVLSQSLEYSRLLGLGSSGSMEAAQVAADELRTQLLDRTFPSGTGVTGLPTPGDRLHEFEATSLGNLRPDSIEAARSLLPTLSRFDDTDIADMLATVARCAGRMDA